MNNNTKVEYSSYIGKEIDVFEFEIHSFKNNKCNSINNEYLHPVRVDDWTFTLLENHK